MINYLSIFIFICLTIFIALAIIILPEFLASKKPHKSKLSPYECGFEPTQDHAGQFNISFYLIAISFIVFDLEIIFLVPWALSLKQLSLKGFVSGLFFIFMLTVGFIYEWKKQVLDSK